MVQALPGEKEKEEKATFPLSPEYLAIYKTENRDIKGIKAKGSVVFVHKQMGVGNITLC